MKHLVLALLLVSTAAFAGAMVQSGEWPDGSAVAWQCSNATQGQVKFLFKTKDGELYEGVLSCGQSI